MRLIDADAEIERLKSDFCKKCERRKPYPIMGIGCTPCWVQDAIEILEDAPEIEAEPVRHGEWEEHNRLYSDIYIDYACSKCHAISSGLDNYCPYCGARMDGDAE